MRRKVLGRLAEGPGNLTDGRVPRPVGDDSRKFAVPLAEYLDRIGLDRPPIGDARILRPSRLGRDRFRPRRGDKSMSLDSRAPEAPAGRGTSLVEIRPESVEVSGREAALRKAVRSRPPGPRSTRARDPPWVAEDPWPVDPSGA